MNRLPGPLSLLSVLGLAVLVSVGCGSAGAPGRSLESRADGVLESLYDREWTRFADFVHPDRGVLFSPLAFVNRDEAIVLHRDQLEEPLLTDSTYVWGYEDGSGHEISATPAEFLKEHILDRDFRAARRGLRDEVIGIGNTINNVPGAFLERRADAGGEFEVAFLEYHDPGTEAFGGMDWASLRLVFERFDGAWYLIGIVRDQWTI